MSDEWRPKVASVPRLAVPVPIDPTGVRGPTKGQASGPFWLRAGPQLYVDLRRRPDCVEQRILEAGAALTRGYVTGWAALRWAGAAFFDGLATDGRTALPVQVSANRERLRSRAGVAVTREVARAGEIQRRRGLRVASPERALFDEVRRRTPIDAVVAIDMATSAELTSRRRFGAYLARRPGARGCRRAADALALAAEGSASPQETRFRLAWTTSTGWEVPLLNRPIFDLAGRFVAKPDLFDPLRGVAGEYQGFHHRSGARHRRDVGRAEALRAVGIEYVEVVGADLHDRSLVAGRLAAAYDRVDPARWRWALGPEPVPLDEVLDQRDALAALADLRVTLPDGREG
jgi:hypothetical protein